MFYKIIILTSQIFLTRPNLVFIVPTSWHLCFTTYFSYTFSLISISFSISSSMHVPPSIFSLISLSTLLTSSKSCKSNHLYPLRISTLPHSSLLVPFALNSYANLDPMSKLRPVQTISNHKHLFSSDLRNQFCCQDI